MKNFKLDGRIIRGNEPNQELQRATRTEFALEQNPFSGLVPGRPVMASMSHLHRRNIMKPEKPNGDMIEKDESPRSCSLDALESIENEKPRNTGTNFTREANYNAVPDFHSASQPNPLSHPSSQPKIPSKDSAFLKFRSTTSTNAIKEETEGPVDFGRRETQKIIDEYFSEIQETLRAKSAAEGPSKFLKNHSISPYTRAKMIDWMVEVLSAFKSSDQTFFVAVGIMDSFMKHNQKRLVSNEMHLLGVTSVFIASKIEETPPIKIKVASDKISHKRLSPESIEKMEEVILETLNFSLSDSTLYDVGRLALRKLLKEDLDCLNEEKKAEEILVQILKMVLMDYELYSSFSNLELGLASVLSLFRLLGEEESMAATFEVVKSILEPMSHLENGFRSK